MSHEKKSKNNAGAEQSPVVPTPEPSPTPAEASEPAPPQLDPRDQEIADQKDRLLRLQADFENFRKRVARDREENARRACETLLKDILPVIDHLELGLRSAQKHHIKHTVIEGFENVHKQLEQVMTKAGVTPIETKGQTFDPRIHECVAHVPSEEHSENTIIEETRRGYLLGSFVLRAPQVIVSNGPAATATEPAGSAIDNNG